MYAIHYNLTYVFSGSIVSSKMLKQISSLLLKFSCKNFCEDYLIDRKDDQIRPSHMT